MAWAIVHSRLPIDYRCRLLVRVVWTWGWLHGHGGDRLLIGQTKWECGGDA